MENFVVTISVERYTELVEAEVKLKMVKKFVEEDNSSYGYCEKTTKAIDSTLCIERNAE